MKLKKDFTIGKEPEYIESNFFLVLFVVEMFTSYEKKNNTFSNYFFFKKKRKKVSLRFH